MTQTASFRVFRRRWWRKDPSAPGGKSPDPIARKTTICFVPTIEEARQMCADWNECHDPGFYGTKAEFESA